MIITIEKSSGVRWKALDSSSLKLTTRGKTSWNSWPNARQEMDMREARDSRCQVLCLSRKLRGHQQPPSLSFNPTLATKVTGIHKALGSTRCVYCPLFVNHIVLREPSNLVVQTRILKRSRLSVGAHLLVTCKQRADYCTTYCRRVLLKSCGSEQTEASRWLVDPDKCGYAHTWEALTWCQNYYKSSTLRFLLGLVLLLVFDGVVFPYILLLFRLRCSIIHLYPFRWGEISL